MAKNAMSLTLDINYIGTFGVFRVCVIVGYCRMYKEKIENYDVLQ